MTIHIEIGEMSGGCISVDSPSLGLFHVLMNTELYTRNMHDFLTETMLTYVAINQPV